MGSRLGRAECVLHLGSSYPREDPSCSGPVPTAKTTLNPAHVRPERRALHKEPRLDDTVRLPCCTNAARQRCASIKPVSAHLDFARVRFVGLPEPLAVEVGALLI